MPKQDAEVKEVLCSETGKPMTKIPQWMADVKVKFVSDEARQKHPPVAGIADLEPIRRGITSNSDIDELKEVDVGAVMEDADGEFEDMEAEAGEMADEEYDA
jgi:hypothetical protein